MSTEAKVWDRFAGRYDRLVTHFDRSYPRVRELLREDLAGRERVLEVAAGTGQFTFDLADVVKQLIASDVSSEMARRLQARVSERAAANVTVEVLSAYALGVADASLDGIFCANALHVMDQPRRALCEFRRALKPGGRLVVPTLCHGVDWARRLLSSLMSLVSPFVAHTRFSPASLEAMVAEAGFETRPSILLPGKLPLAYLVADRPAGD